MCMRPLPVLAAPFQQAFALHKYVPWEDLNEDEKILIKLSFVTFESPKACFLFFVMHFVSLSPTPVPPVFFPPNFSSLD